MFSFINKYYNIFLINIKQNLMYISDILAHILFIGIVVFIFANMWKIIYATQGAIIPSFTLSMMVWYLVFGEALSTSIGKYIVEVGDDIKSGEIANYLTKPYNYIIYKISMALSKSILSFFLTFMIGGVVAYLMVGTIKISLISVPFLLITFLLSFILSLVIASFIALFSFWIEDARGINFVYYKLLFLLGGMLFPLELYPLVVEKIASFLPFSYITYHVAKLVLIFSYTQFIKVVLFQLLWIVLFTIILIILYNIVIKKVSVNGG